MEQYNVTGMSCAACSTRVEKAVRGVEGVTEVSVNLLTNSMLVEGTADSSAIITAVEQAGYGAEKKVRGAQNPQADGTSASASDALADKETPKMKRRLIASLCFLIPLMYLSMGHMMWGWWIGDFLANNMLAQGITQLLLTGIIMVINQKFFFNGFGSLMRKIAEHGYARRTGRQRFLRLQCLCALWHESGGAGGGRGTDDGISS